MTKDTNKNANNMGGPSFHPQIKTENKLDKTHLENDKNNKGQVLDKDQIPPL